MRTLSQISVAAVLATACGSGSAPSVAPTPASRPIVFVAFLDENRNGAVDAFESIRIPGAEITFGGASAKSVPSTGEATLTAIPTTQTLSVLPVSLPPYHLAPEAASITPPVTGPVPVPITLPLGSGAVPGVYLAFGDSITNGQVGVGDGQGYIGQLERMLAAHFGRARVISDGLDSSSSERGDSRIAASLVGGRPAFTLIQYGTNDWSDARCVTPPCFTIDSLRSMVRKVKAQGGHAFVGTLLMTNVGKDFRASPQRNSWVLAQNELIRKMASEEEVVLVDLHAAFEKSPYTYNELFADYIHPSAIGYKVMAEAWFEAITKRQ